MKTIKRNNLKYGETYIARLLNKEIAYFTFREAEIQNNYKLEHYLLTFNKQTWQTFKTFDVYSNKNAKKYKHLFTEEYINLKDMFCLYEIVL